MPPRHITRSARWGRIERLEGVEENRDRQVGRPRFPRTATIRRADWIIPHRIQVDFEVISDLGQAPAHDVKGFARGSESVRTLVGGIRFGCPRRQSIPLSDYFFQGADAPPRSSAVSPLSLVGAPIRSDCVERLITGDPKRNVRPTCRCAPTREQDLHPPNRWPLVRAG